MIACLLLRLAPVSAWNPKSDNAAVTAPPFALSDTILNHASLVICMVFLNVVGEISNRNMYFVAKRVGALQAAVPGRKSSCVVRASTHKRHSGSEDASELNMSLLEKRIVIVQSQEAARKAIARRPSLPHNTLFWNEIEQDHKLIVNWHEQAWNELRGCGVYKDKP